VAQIANVCCKLGLEISYDVTVGPFKVDMMHLASNTVVEVNYYHQFYANTKHLTATSRRRHDLLSAMGFNLIQIPFFVWDSLEDEPSKALFIKNLMQK